MQMIDKGLGIFVLGCEPSLFFVPNPERPSLFWDEDATCRCVDLC